MCMTSDGHTHMYQTVLSLETLLRDTLEFLHKGLNGKPGHASRILMRRRLLSAG